MRQAAQEYIDKTLSRLNWKAILAQGADGTMNTHRSLVMRWHGYCDGAGLTRQEAQDGHDQIADRFFGLVNLNQPQGATH